MQRLRILLYLAAVLAVVITWSLGAALIAAGPGDVHLSLIVASGAFGLLVAAGGAAAAWAIPRARDLDALNAALREAGDDPGSGPLFDRHFHDEIDDVARSIERLHATAVREKVLSTEHRVAMNQIIDSFGEGLIAISPNGRIVLANRRVAEIVGSPVELAGRSILEVIRKPSIPGALSKALNGDPCIERVSIEGMTGERHIEIRFFPVAASAEIAAVALLIDVTTVERLQRMRTDFLDDFSHEVRTPLAGLRSAAETLQHGGLRREDESQLRNVVVRQIARIERLVTDLSDLNQIESGRIELRREHVSLHDLLAGLCEDVRERGGVPAARLTLADGDATADVDAARVTQVFTNLLDNALKHGGGRGEILVAVTRESGEAVVRVSDSGDGIPPAELDRIFNRFYRVDRSRSQAVPGTGLGLAIAKHLTLLHGGAIRAYNREGGGATFEVRLAAV